MSQESSLESLKKKHDETWAEYQRRTYEEYEPRFYKQRVGRKQEPINPWKDLAERIEVENRIIEAFRAWNKLHIQYIAKTGDRPMLPRTYIQKETPDGPRWVKESPEEAASYETALRKLQSPHPS